ncbi:AbiV family abortive infection protein [Nitrosotalea sinensis]|uniref:AbiV family abortive infection protein n=1 Tax=Nitrosotalea sinensis TaxID=1499975 RepID=UPI0013FD15BC|nr:AbiV family abortive infection protein [Candidatus Nitrosotalea sinensis]
MYFKASKLALDNSRLICDEAQFLIDKNHYARGFALSIISLEESAKSFLLRLISLDLVYEDKTMKFVRNHESKLQQSSQILSLSPKLIQAFVGLAQMAQDAGYIKTEIEIPKNYHEKIKQLEEITQMVAKYHNKKNDSLYVDVREGRIINPNEITKKEQASTIAEMADMQIDIVEIAHKLDDSKCLEIWKSPYVSMLKIDHLLKS